jgi:hypothetical protein
MTRFRVQQSRTVYVWYEIELEARDGDHAVELATNAPKMAWSEVGDLEDPDTFEILEVVEVDEIGEAIDHS